MWAVGYSPRRKIMKVETLSLFSSQRTSCWTCGHVVILERQALQAFLSDFSGLRDPGHYVPQVSFTALPRPGILSFTRTHSFRQLSKMSNCNYQCSPRPASMVWRSDLWNSVNGLSNWLSVYSNKYQTVARDYCQGCYNGLKSQPRSPRSKEL